jgi:hypothetical protein
MTQVNEAEYTEAMAAYFREGERLADTLGNRGSIKFNADGTLHPDIVNAYKRIGVYVLEGALNTEEINDLRKDLTDVFDRAPYTKDAVVDGKGRPALGIEFARQPFSFAKPLSDELGGTSLGNGRHMAKMREPLPRDDAPDYVISKINGQLHFMDSCLRLYGHPQLLAIAEQINGPDFTPFAESIIVKPAGLGATVAWHQDGTRLWDKPDWDEDTHGFNFMAQLYGSTAANGLWVIPGSHKEGKIDIKAMIEANNGSDCLPGAVPLVCEPGDVVMTNRQALHGSFANTSADQRMTINFGFHRRSSVLGLRKTENNQSIVYDDEHIFERSRIIALAIDARQQRYTHEPRYVYQPMVGQEESNRWSDTTRESILKDYNIRNLGI